MKIKQAFKNKKKIATIVLISILIVLFISVIFAVVNMYNPNMIKGVSIGKIKVENKSKEETKSIVEEIINKRLSKEITLQNGDFEISITGNQIDAKYDVDNAVIEAYKVGRAGNIVQNNYKILKTILFNTDIELKFSYNEELLNKLIEDINGKIPNAVENFSYYIEDEQLIITPGKNGIKVQEEELKKLVLDLIKKDGKEKEVAQLPVNNAYPEDIDIEKIHQEIYKEAKDAYVNITTRKVIPDVEGIDFAITKEEVKEMLKEKKEVYIIPLKMVKPDKTLGELGDEIFVDELSVYTTKYDLSNTNRNTNMELAAKKINGTILLPGEIFSYNKVVGKRTEAAGYKVAAVYANGKVENGIGGGICQISSTLYNTVLLANLEIVERYNHHFLTSYVTNGRDATVSWGTLDFKFKNNRTYPIKIIASVKNGIVNISIKGIKEEKEYEVIIETKTIETIEPQVKYQNDSSILSGQEVVFQKGFNGCISETYKILKYGDQIVSRTLLSKDTYSAMERIIKKGTGKESFQTVSPEENTSVTDEFGGMAEEVENIESEENIEN